LSTTTWQRFIQGVIFALSLVGVGVGLVLLAIVLLTLRPTPTLVERGGMLLVALGMAAAVVAVVWWPVASQQAAAVFGALLVVPLWRGSLRLVSIRRTRELFFPDDVDGHLAVMVTWRWAFASGGSGEVWPLPP